MIGRTRSPSRKPIWCSTSPSRASKPTRSDHFSHSTRLPVTVKLGPCGWVISIGFCVVRSGPTTSGSV
ncbi:Uncharacterised protein [Mycobacteroides abscessus subsp. abscessus]|nr:Uncharacterised protein [Mycobacteroides abscessus subsp. abscessus]